ncbi:hypothetical protein HDU81_005852 [Chytriomyces hyalinus]|nr:hypothetical protein HDU81_005852 [Chytriomyces hyalinus]
MNAVEVCAAALPALRTVLQPCATSTAPRCLCNASSLAVYNAVLTLCPTKDFKINGALNTLITACAGNGLPDALSDGMCAVNVQLGMSSLTPCRLVVNAAGELRQTQPFDQTASCLCTAPNLATWRASISSCRSQISLVFDQGISISKTMVTACEGAGLGGTSAATASSVTGSLVASSTSMAVSSSTTSSSSSAIASTVVASTQVKSSDSLHHVAFVGLIAAHALLL